MSQREPRPTLRLLAALVLSAAVAGPAAEVLAQSECLVAVKSLGATVADESTVCAEAQNKVCLFQLQLCVNEGDAGCPAAAMKKKVRAKGNCRKVGKLRVKPNGSNATCGTPVGIKVKTKKKGRREGTCTIRVSAREKGGERRDVDELKLVCKPNPGECPAVTVTPTTTTTLPACVSPCPCCVLPITALSGCISG
jgi:hypothetical protein